MLNMPCWKTRLTRPSYHLQYLAKRRHPSKKGRSQSNRNDVETDKLRNKTATSLGATPSALPTKSSKSKDLCCRRTSDVALITAVRSANSSRSSARKQIAKF